MNTGFQDEKKGESMKKFFAVTPQQKEGNLKPQRYQPQGNERLSYRETCFPIVAVMNGYLQEGDRAQLVTVTYDNDDCRRNLKTLKEEVATLCTEKSCSCEIASIDTPFDDSAHAVVHVFQQLIDYTDDEDDLFACITYGSKPMVLAITMALQYSYRLKRNAYLDCVVYGQIDRSKEPAQAKIYDITALIQLDEIVRLLAEQGIAQPEKFLQAVVGKE